MKKQFLKRISSLVLVLLMTMGCCISASATPAATPDKTIDKDKEVSLTIHKYEMETMPTKGAPGNGEAGATVPGTAKALNGVSYSIYKVADDYAKKDAEGNYVTPAGEATAKGETKGEGVVAFTKLKQGRYLVVETAAPAHVYEMSPSFLVDLPMVNANGDGWNYDVHVYPKNAAVLGSFVLTKTGEGGDKDGLGGAKFVLQKKDAAGAYVNVSDQVYETDDNGHLVFNDLLKGEYQLIETGAPDGYGKNEKPVTFTIDKNGKTNADGTTKSGTVVRDSLANYKVPDAPGKIVSSDTVNQGQEVVWTITPSIPTDIDTYQSYIVTDQLDARLTYKGIKVTAKKGDETTDITAKCAITQVSGLVTVNFVNCKADLVGTTVSIDITTVVNEKVLETPGIIPNHAEVSYTNAYGTEGKPKSPEVSVFTGNIKVIKTNEEKTPLDGAKFKLYPTLADAKAGTNQIHGEQITKDGGFAYFKGLKAGTYFLVETQTPTYEDKDGNTLHYNMMSAPEKVELEIDDEDGVVEVPIVNKKQGFSIPITGSSSTILMLCIGAMLISGSAILMVLRKKKAVQ